MEFGFVRPVTSAEFGYTPDADLAVNTIEKVNIYEDEFPTHHTDTIQEVRIQQLKVHVK